MPWQQPKLQLLAVQVGTDWHTPPSHESPFGQFSMVDAYEHSPCEQVPLVEYTRLAAGAVHTGGGGVVQSTPAQASLRQLPFEQPALQGVSVDEYTHAPEWPSQTPGDW